jgi:hypothetical protein
MTLKLKNILIVLLTSLTVTASAQTFDLLAMSSSDKIAQSSNFNVSQNGINMFATSSVTHPTSIISGDTMMVARVSKSATSVGGQNSVVDNFALDQNYPNPFNLSTVIRFSLPEPAVISIKVYDVTGREIATVVNEMKSAGVHSVGFGNNQLSTGTYMYRMTASTTSGKTTVETKKMIVMK